MYREAGGMSLPSCSFMMQESLFPVQEEERHPLLPFPAFDDLLLPELNLSNAALGLGDINFAMSEYDGLVGADVGELFKVPNHMQEGSLLIPAIPLMPDNYGIAGMDSTQHEDLMLSAAFSDSKTGCSLQHHHQLFPVPLPQGQAPDFVIPPAPQTAAAVEESLQKSDYFGCLTPTTGGGSLTSEANYNMDVEVASGTNLMMLRRCSEGDIQVFDDPDMKLEAAAFAMRTYSDGDVQGIGVNTSFARGDGVKIVTCFELLSALEDMKLEERSRKLSRYRKKRTQRNFGRKIKYACRKTLADSQPRIRGRFAKMKGTHNDLRMKK